MTGEEFVEFVAKHPLLTSYKTSYGFDMDYFAFFIRAETDQHFAMFGVDPEETDYTEGIADLYAKKLVNSLERQSLGN